MVLFRHLLIGRGQHLQPLLEAVLTLEEAARDARWDAVSVTLRNHTSSPFRLRSAAGTEQTFAGHADLVDVAPHSTQQLRVTSDVPGPTVTLEFEVLSALTAPGTHPRLALTRALGGSSTAAE